LNFREIFPRPARTPPNAGAAGVTDVTEPGTDWP